MRYNRLDRFVQDITRDAGNSVRNNFGVVTSGKEKTGKSDIVTKADYEAEAILISAIRKRYPHHGIYSEEAGELPGSGEYTWILDPLDGTNNFAKGIPLFGVLVALAKGNQVTHGAIFDPIHDELFYARAKAGAYLNGKPIRVSTETDMEDMTLYIGNVKGRSSLEQFAHWRSLFALFTTSYKNYSSAGQAFAHLACGRIDSYLTGGIYPWDAAAGVLLVKEAGGKVTTLQGLRWYWEERNQHVLAANSALHKKMLQLISQR